MLLPLALALVTAVALIVVLGPLLGVQRAAPERIEYDRSVYRDQLAELERDHARGVIGDAEAASARLEIERRMLTADRARPATLRQARPIPVLAMVLALLVAGAAGALYLVVGAPAVPDQPFAERAANRAPAEDDLDVKALAAKVAEKPDDVDGWMDLGRAEATQRDWQKSVDAYRHAASLAPQRADIGAGYGEVQVLAADGIVTPGAEAEFRKVQAEDPASGIARYYLALADAQAGRTQQAIDAWQKLAAESPANAPIRAELKNRIDEAAQSAGIAAPPLAPPAPASPAAVAGAAPPGPNQEQMAAAANMTPEQRQAMIHSMVDQLAAKLQSTPDDLAGWMRLAKAYSVLDERDKAADAYEHAAKLDPKNVDIPLGEVDALLDGDALDQSLPDRVVALLHRIETLSPQQPEALWYLGLAAAQAHQPDQAAGYWQRLLAALPPDAPERKTVTDALATVKGK
jgi:cytochrome c-type biogenesis protein CcmH